eukprot:TRINITY_DN12003_c0_g1_i2.p1 TRINITY_DN12003_c0_g1~~TRINITY_DN12003_c0_g1_i2.p1  ORF type:complete len:219 (-),score=38.69 TRINITY_DN12003_c0_g1_i2:80-736(-)
MSAFAVRAVLAVAVALVSVDGAESPFELRDETHFQRKRTFSSASDIRQAMAERLRNRRKHAQAHPRAVSALRKSHELASHPSAPEVTEKLAEQLPFSKTWSQRHGKVLHSEPEPKVSLLATRQGVVHRSHSKSHHRSHSHAAARTQSNFAILAREAASHVVHEKVSSGVIDEFKSGMTAQVQQEEQWQTSRNALLLQLRQRQQAVKKAEASEKQIKHQ